MLLRSVGSKRLFSSSSQRCSNIGMKAILVPQEVSIEIQPLKQSIIKRKGRSLLTLSQQAKVKGP
ncbi:unnamed protein product [Cyberlindnera jadinii]|nr:unnamed protein product [Cyberlindnera jadinii]